MTEKIETYGFLSFFCGVGRQPSVLHRSLVPLPTAGILTEIIGQTIVFYIETRWRRGVKTREEFFNVLG